VVSIIAIVAVLAIPTLSAAQVDRRVFADAGYVSQLFRIARTRAVGRGAAVLVEMSPEALGTHNHVSPQMRTLFDHLKVKYVAMMNHLPNMGGHFTAPHPILAHANGGSALARCRWRHRYPGVRQSGFEHRHCAFDCPIRRRGPHPRSGNSGRALLIRPAPSSDRPLFLDPK
jgi:hypothetical protein